MVLFLSDARFSSLMGEKVGRYDTVLNYKSAVKGFVGFDLLLSNPPYQVDNGNGSVTSIYHHFMNVAKLVSMNVSMVFPARWVLGGSGEGINLYRENEIKSREYRRFDIFSYGKSLFENVEIKGGVNYFLWSRGYAGNVDYAYNYYRESRKSISNGFTSVIVDPVFAKIVNKVSTKNHLVMGNRLPYGVNTENDMKIMRAIEGVSPEKRADCSRIFYIDRSKVLHSVEIPRVLLSKDDGDFEVVVSKTATPDKRGGVVSLNRADRILSVDAGESVSGTFITKGFASRIERDNCLLYLKSDFANFLVGVLAITHNAARKVYELVPDVDFVTGEIVDKPGVRLDFSKPETLDDQLAEIYGLSDGDRVLISSKIRRWRDKLSLSADKGR